MQVLKDSVRQDILEAAIQVFSRQGFPTTTMAQIAKEAGISTGNIYRYFPSKEELFDAALPAEFVTRFKSDLRDVLTAAEGLSELLKPTGENQSYQSKMHEMLFGSALERGRLLVLLDRAEATRYETLRTEIIELFEKHATLSAKRQFPGFKLTGEKKKVLRLIYSAYLKNLCEILRTDCPPEELVSIMQHYRLYHLAGIQHFMEAKI